MESLNIPENIKHLVLKALNRYRKKEDAALALGISMKRLKWYRIHFFLMKIDGQWQELSEPIKAYIMRELTPEEKLFIDQGYTELLPREMAKGLKIRVELVRAYMHAQEYRSISNRNPLPLTDEEKEEIRKNCGILTINQLAVKLLRSFNLIKRFGEAEQLSFKITNSGRPAKKRIQRIHKPIEQTKIIRHPAVYSNTDWKQYGEEILNRQL